MDFGTAFSRIKMKKILLAILAITLFSCAEKEEDASQKKSIGKINSLSVFIDDKLWIGEIGDSIRKKFAAPVDGLPQEEPLFTINQYPVRAFDGYLLKNRNAILVKKETKNLFTITENEFAVPQNVIRISGNSTAIILGHIERNAPTIISLFQQTEISESQKLMEKNLRDGKKMEKNFRVSMQIPKDFKCVLRKDKFVWLKKEIQSGNSSILIYEIPITSIVNQKDIVSNIVKMRDSVGGLYIHGTMENSKMITEESYAPYLINSILDGKKVFETKGTWEMKNDFMAGPFTNYAILDKENNRILVIEGFCYAPSTPKRDLVHELESIIRTAKLTK